MTVTSKAGKPGTKVAVVSKAKNAVAAMPSAAELAADGSVGQFERNDLTIPFLKIIQALSPYRQKQDPQFIKGAAEGMFLNTATKQLYDGEDSGVVVVPVAYTRNYTEWTPMDEGGGFIKDHGDDGSIIAKCTKNDKGTYITPDGTEIVDAALYYVLIVDTETGEYSQAAFVLKGSQWKKARSWNTEMDSMRIEMDGRKLKPAIFYHAWRVKTIPESNEQGNWYGVKFELEAPVFELEGGARLYADAKALLATVHRGEVKVKMSDTETESPSGGDEV